LEPRKSIWWQGFRFFLFFFFWMNVVFTPQISTWRVKGRAKARPCRPGPMDNATVFRYFLLVRACVVYRQLAFSQFLITCSLNKIIHSFIHSMLVINSTVSTKYKNVVRRAEILIQRTIVFHIVAWQTTKNAVIVKLWYLSKHFKSVATNNSTTDELPQWRIT